MGRRLVPLSLSELPTGHRFVAVLRTESRAQPNGKFSQYVLLRCVCGRTCERRADVLRRADARSCGCLQREAVGLRARKHGMYAGADAKHPLYRTWTNMISRCYQPTLPCYPRYGGRGITVCHRWQGKRGFANFVADMGERPEGHTIDRVDNDKGYSPKNCRWATKKEQQQNLRSNSVMSFRGETLTVSEWARRIGVRKGTLTSRLRRGWTIERALTATVGEA